MNTAHTHRKTSFILVSMIILIAFGLFLAKEQATVRASSTLTFTPSADSYVDQSNANTNYGSKTSLRVDGSSTVRSYLRFDVSGITGTVRKVTLKIYANSASNTGFEVHKVSNNGWAEESITFSNAPAPGTIVGTSGKFSRKSWVATEVTSLLDANGTISIALTGINETAINLASRGDASHTPQLLLEVSAPLPTSMYTSTPGATSTPTETPAPAQGGNDPIIFFVGDLVAGRSVDRADAVVKLIQNLMRQHPNTQMLVASTGDNEQENNPTVEDYQSYFNATYGPFVDMGIFMQVRGNHDIQSAGSYTDFDGKVHNSGAAYWDYFGPNAHMANINGKKLTDYSYNLGSWHIVGLDQLNGSVNKNSLAFLTADLAANPNKICQIVYWHVPTYSSGTAHGDSTGLKPLNQAEFNAGVDIQLNGHDHDYQRFYPINPDGVRDDALGITTFISGIGGQDGGSGSNISAAQAASAIYLDTFPGGAGHAIGVIMFTLRDKSADYKLYNANDGSVLDSGTVMCH